MGSARILQYPIAQTKMKLLTATLAFLGVVANASENVPEGPCDQPIDTGFCRAYFLRFGYDKAANACVPFVYGGCASEDNINRFTEMIDCMNACGNEETAAVFETDDFVAEQMQVHKDWYEAEIAGQQEYDAASEDDAEILDDDDDDDD